MAEIPGLFFQRPIIRRHQKAALYYPFIDSLAHTIVDIPISLISAAVTSVILYFLVGLQNRAAQFLCVISYNSTQTHDLCSTFLLFMSTVTLVMKACFRSIAAFSTAEPTALSAAAVTLEILVLYTGFAIPIPSIVGALRWISYLNVCGRCLSISSTLTLCSFSPSVMHSSL